MPRPPQITHHEDCYKVHHECAIREVERLRGQDRTDRAVSGEEPQEVADAELDSVEVARTISRARQSGEDVEAIADKCPGCGQHHPIVETLVTRCSGCDTILRSRASKGETDRELWFSTSYKMGEDTYYRAYETNCRKGLVRGVVRFARLAGEDHGSRFMNQEREDDHER
jgi:hypothetical protein